MNDNMDQAIERNGDAAIDEWPVTPWRVIAAAAVVLAVALVLCLTLLVRFLETRPLDLRQESQVVARTLESIFEKQGIPAVAVVSGPFQSKNDDTGFWYERSYKVTVPQGLTASAIAQAIHAAMADRNVSIVDARASASDITELRLAEHGRDMAIVRLFGKPQPTDYTKATRAVAAQVVETLRAYSPPVLSVVQNSTEPMSNKEAVWESANITVELPATIVQATAFDTLRRRINNSDVTVDPAPSKKTATATILYKGLDCVNVTLQNGLPEQLLAVPKLDLPLLAFQLGGLDVNDVMRIALPDQEALPLDSSDLDGDARKQAFPIPEPREWETPRLAIIVDDGGYGGPITDRILALDTNLTLSILPHATFSTTVAKRAEQLGFQVMLHMPMENSTGHLTFPGQITTDMTPEQIHQLTKEALEEIPGAVGVNNHTGSKFTSDANAMKVFLDGIKDTKLFFVDSRTIGTTQAYHVAREMKIPCAARDLFLDNESDPTYIRARFKQLIEICQRQGQAIGICHFRKNTVPVLEEMLAVIKKDGIQLVHVSELIP